MQDSFSSPPIDVRELTDATRQALGRTLDRLRKLRRQPVSAQWVEELEAIRFRGLRLGKRLEQLERDGLVNISACRQVPVSELVQLAASELGPELHRRAIRMEVDLGEGPTMWLDPDQFLEALRCMLDDALARIGDEENLEIAVAEDESALEVSVAHRGKGEGDRDAAALLAHLTSHLWAEVATDEQEGLTRCRLRLPRRTLRMVGGPLRPAITPRRWVFPAPSAA